MVFLPLLIMKIVMFLSLLEFTLCVHSNTVRYPERVAEEERVVILLYNAATSHIMPDD